MVHNWKVVARTEEYLIEFPTQVTEGPITDAMILTYINHFRNAWGCVTDYTDIDDVFLIDVRDSVSPHFEILEPGDFWIPNDFLKSLDSQTAFYPTKGGEKISNGENDICKDCSEDCL